MANMERCSEPEAAGVDRVSDAARSQDPVAPAPSGAADEFLLSVYQELRQLASAKLARERPGQTLQATALVHEAWLRLHGTAGRYHDRSHFFNAAAEAMRRILVDRARRRAALKRGAAQAPLPLDEIEVAVPSRDDDEMLLVSEALDKLALVNPRKAELVKLRYFVGLSFEEAAGVLAIAVPTAKEWWAHSRAWLAVEVRKSLNG